MRIATLVGPDRFGPLLVMLFSLFISVPLLQETEYGFAVVCLLSALLVAAALVACGVRRRWRLLAIATGAVAATSAAVGALATDGAAPAWVSAVFAIMLGALPLLVLRRILGHERVTLSTVAGALCTFMLVGLAFAAVYRSIDVAAPGSFSAELGSASGYFSFVTLTTLGYGDITPVSSLAQSLTVVEAVMGQVLMVTLVARFVSTLGQLRVRRVESVLRDEPASTGTPSKTSD